MAAAPRGAQPSARRRAPAIEGGSVTIREIWYERLRKWVRQAERDAGQRPGVTRGERDRIQALECEVRALRQANEILREASAYFARAELDRRHKP
jgi:hypothetical protein